MLEFSSDIKVLTTVDKSSLYEVKKIDASEFINYATKEIKPSVANNYIADDASCHDFAAARAINDTVFFGEEMQTGWCYGGGVKMNGMEWHETPETVIACTDTVLLLGDYYDVIDDTYDSAKAVALELKRGEVVILNPRTLHLAPLAVDEYFIAAILLPKNTNLPLPDGINGTHRAINKWLLVHKENAKGIALGGQIGVTGDNITLLK